MMYDKLIGTHKKQAEKIAKHSNLILGGILVAIDPSSKSMGWAIYERGELINAGVATGEGGVGERMAQIYDNLPNVEPDIIITELVRSSTGHIYLSWSNGAMLAKYGSPQVLEVSTNLWKKAADSDYYKSDVQDAKYIGKFAIDLCKEREELSNKGESQ